ncbi:iron-siderophore ABC transporter substrate-binding protein [Phormidium pseudopriestleyi FRX01]|uniref:Iron-siderophore ABC transporter substrate-binding protein n=1 Tax=Phormidium pseudopriestleyi FRX01 TaxID=1759528 RepID=A0ABS3FXS1_9CYAN|nr:iron-siderophore ABC transporter substrate-binding protein [Phormidium pseudopriestleyi]MBO0351147.1 iron-siderophore ABC transporter substrate-binding protein [Phormidium pseudopriestleyi FRX01]
MKRQTCTKISLFSATSYLGKLFRFILYFAASLAVVACTNGISSQTEVNSSLEFAETPTRIVALEWVYVEDLLALGIQPVGVADIAGYHQFVQIEPQLADPVMDVGTRQEPSLEAIAQLEPDLIIGVNLRHEAIASTLSAIAPTLLFDPYPAPETGIRQLDEMEQTFLKIAEVVNAKAKGEAVLQQMRSKFEDAAQQLKGKQLAQTPFILGQFVSGAPQIRLFNNNAMAVQILQQLGLTNAWQGAVDPFGFNTAWIESLPPVENANFFYSAQENNPYFKQLKQNLIWKNLAFVKESRLYSIGSETWIFGGPLSAEVFVDKVVQALMANREDLPN